MDHPDMYGPPPNCKRKMSGQGWSAQMYTAFIGVKGLRATMECATLSSHLLLQSWKTLSGCGFRERRIGPLCHLVVRQQTWQEIIKSSVAFSQIQAAAGRGT